MGQVSFNSNQFEFVVQVAQVARTKYLDPATRFWAKMDSSYEVPVTRHTHTHSTHEGTSKISWDKFAETSPFKSNQFEFVVQVARTRFLIPVTRLGQKWIVHVKSLQHVTHTVHMKGQAKFHWTSPRTSLMNSIQFGFVGQVAGTKCWTLQLYFLTKMGSSHEGAWSSDRSY